MYQDDEWDAISHRVKNELLRERNYLIIFSSFFFLIFKLIKLIYKSILPSQSNINLIILNVMPF
jgi:hypothetical protein